MADIRINSLPTTASASSSDDFLALDGATNGTRKLNAYSPTFGGNLTVSGGTGTIDATSGTASATLNLVGRSSGTAKTASVLANSAGSLVLGAEGAGSSLTIAANTGNTTVAYNLTVSGTQMQMGGVNPFIQGTTGAGYIQFQNAGDVVVASNTGKLVLIANGSTRATVATTGNFLIGTTTDSGNGKLQLADHTTSAGGIGFGTDVNLFRNTTSQLRFSSGSSYGIFQIQGASGSYVDFYATDGTTRNGSVGTEQAGTMYVGTRVAASTIFLTNSTTALTLDSSQNATFAGRVRAGTAVGTAKTVLIDAAFTTLLNVTKTFTVTMPSPSLASSFVLEVGVYGNTATGYASLMVKGGGYLGTSTLYEATELTKINSGSVTISSVTKANGSMTFTVINTSSSGHVAICYKQTSDDVFTTLPTITAV